MASDSRLGNVRSTLLAAVGTFSCLLFLACKRGDSASHEPTQANSTSAHSASPEATAATSASVHAATPAERPAPPLKLAAPSVPSDDVAPAKWKQLGGEELLAVADRSYQDGEYRKAVLLQSWGVQKAGHGRYNLACYYALLGNVDGALYWIQEAAATEGVDAAGAARDGDLKSVRPDPRWQSVARYLESYERFWAASGLHDERLIVPDGYHADRAIPLLVGLHGLGANAEEFAEEQSRANALGMAFLAVSGTIPSGPRAFRWSEDPLRDEKRIADAIKSVTERVKAESGKIVLYGFSQGAQSALEIAARFPERYAGAIALSPGNLSGSRLGKVEPGDAIKRSGFVIAFGSGEAPGNVTLGKADAKALEALGARVLLRPSEGQTAHAFPADFAEALPKWVGFLLKPPG